MFTFNFEKLDVWQKAIDFADLIYTSTAGFPEDERFGLTSQLRRASVSVASNIAEGSSRTSSTDFSRFLEIATGSVYEVVTHSTIAARRGYLSKEQHQAIFNAASELTRMLSGLRKSLLGKP